LLTGIVVSHVVGGLIVLVLAMAAAVVGVDGGRLGLVVPVLIGIDFILDLVGIAISLGLVRILILGVDEVLGLLINVGVVVGRWI
jgi:hypothetical protein